jgi:hypothetical protein
MKLRCSRNQSLLLFAGLLFLMLFVAPLTPAQEAKDEAKQVARKVDEFGELSGCDWGARFDNLAIQLMNEPSLEGYVITYGPEGEGSGTGKNLLERIKDYFINTRGVDEEHIKTIYGGRYKEMDEVFTELWLVPRGADAPERQLYRTKIKTIAGKFVESEVWDGIPEGDGFTAGNVTLAGFADALRQQPETRAYIIAFNAPDATPGSWRRVAKRYATELEENYGIKSDRIQIIYAGYDKQVKGEERIVGNKMQLWILPKNAPAPVKEAGPEREPTEAVRIVDANSRYWLRYPDKERLIMEGFADVLRANEHLSVCFIVRPPNGEGSSPVDSSVETNEPPDVDLMKLVDKWKAKLGRDYGVKENRITVIPAAPDEYNADTLEVWVVPAGAALPDPYARDELMEDDTAIASEEGKQ